jgi:DNA-binding transcriptional LysR family regulator
MNISLRQLKGFILVTRLGNFSRAAEQLHMTQAGLSIMIRELEAQLDCRLFDRTTRLVSLTPVGEQFLPAALRALADIETAAAQINAVGEKARYTLRVAAAPLVSTSLMPAVFRCFRDAYPEVTVRLVDCDLARVHTLVDTGEVDFGLGFFLKPAAGIERTLLHSSQLMRVQSVEGEDEDEDAGTGARDLLFKGWAGQRATVGKAPWSALQSANLIGLSRSNPIQQLIETHLAKIDRANKDIVTFNHIDTLISMAAAGMGTAIIPSIALLACSRYRIKADLLSHPTVSLGFYRITKSGRAKAPAIVNFTETLLSVLPDLVATAAIQAEQRARQ